MEHPRYDGPVVDTHVHFDATTVGHAGANIDAAGLRGALHLWDASWPPPAFGTEAAAWGTWDPRLLRCHVPEVTLAAEPGGEERLDRELRTAAAAGATGVKLWKNLGLWLRTPAGERLAVDHPGLDAVWETAADVGLPILIHQGDTPAFFAPLDEHNHRREELERHPEWWYGGGDFAPLQQIHDEFEAVVARHPRTTFVGLHFGCFMAWDDVARMLDAYPNYHVDTATTVADMGRDDAWEAVRRVIVEHPDRVLFGTDWVRTGLFDIPVVPAAVRWDPTDWYARHFAFFETAEPALEHPLQVQGDWTVHGLDLPDDVLRKLYWDNAARLLDLTSLEP